MTYQEKLKEAMGELAKEEKVVFLGEGLTRMQDGTGKLNRVLAALLLSAALAAAVSIGSAWATEDEDIELGTRLADMLRAGRNVVSANQDLINDPEIGDKGFTRMSLVMQAEALYIERVGAPWDAEGLTQAQMQLLEAQ